MPRGDTHRLGEIVYMCNRASARSNLFNKPADYFAFERIMTAGMHRTPIRLLLEYCFMPNIGLWFCGQ
jgi:hypothetical protein